VSSSMRVCIFSHLSPWLPPSVAAFAEVSRRQRTDSALSFTDAVLNHKAGADFAEKFHAIEVDSEDRNKELTEPVRFFLALPPPLETADRLFLSQYEIEGWTGFNFPGRKGVHSKMEWHHYHFTGVDWDNKNGKKAIFKIQGDGKDWAEDVDGEKGSFDYLMFSDIDHDHPEVRLDRAVSFRSTRRLTFSFLFAE
jgi:alpha-amylase